MINYDEETKIFHLNTPHTSYCMTVVDDSYIAHLYYGERITRSNLNYLLRLHEYVFPPSERPDEKAGFFDRLPAEYPVEGGGDFREACLGVRNDRGLISPELFFTGWKIHKKKKKLPGLPQTFGENAQTLELSFRDSVSGLVVYLIYTVFEDADVLVRNAVIRNESGNALYLTRALTACLSLPAGKGKTLTFGGAWAREHLPVWREAGYGGTVSESRRGAPGHGGQPFMGFCYDQGGLFGMHMLYSGSYLAKLEQDSFGDYRMVLGIHPDTFSWKLEEGEVFHTPEAVLFYTPDGTAGMTHILHDFYRAHLIRGFGKQRPVLINNWEATYFDFDEERLLSIAREAAELGIDTFVVDDGWFGRGRMEPSGDLGDWIPSKKKMPGGLKAFSLKLRALGIRLGLWFEPEMVSEESELFRAHPDWVLHQEGRIPAKCRDQWILDLANPQVRDYLTDSIAFAIREGAATYIKWDMNRMLSEAGSPFLPPCRQGEIWHRHVLGVYEIQERLLEMFPDLIIENCASGGARFDPGMLYYSPQIWCSDNMDPVDRIRIHEGTAMLYPLSTIGSHVSKSPNDITGRVTSFKTRSITGMFGSFGYELDITRLASAEKHDISRQINLYRRLRPMIFEGDYYCLVPIGENGRYQAYEVLSKERDEGFVVFFQNLVEPNGRGVRLCLKGLANDCDYEIGGRIYSGDALLKAGYIVPYVKQDFYAEIIEFKAVSSKNRF